MTIDEYKKQIAEEYPEMTLVKIENYEDAEHQTYKSKYERLSEKIEEIQSDAFSKDAQRKEMERENIALHQQNEMFKRENSAYRSQTLEEFVKFIKKVTEEEIVITNVKAMDLDLEEIKASNENFHITQKDLADRPGVYSHKRPSFFTPLRNELNKSNEAKKVTKNTKGLLKENLRFWKRAAEEKETKSNEELKRAYEANRKRNLLKIINEDCSNEERYLKYMLITPGMDKDYLDTLNGAAEIGLDARIIISLLEQPEESFNKEMIEAYVSEAHKGTEYNHRKELAEELIEGSWYITAEINGRREKFQLAPVKFIKELEANLKKIQSLFEGKQEENEEPQEELVYDRPNEPEMNSENHGFEMDIPEMSGDGEEDDEGFSDSALIDGLGDYSTM